MPSIITRPTVLITGGAGFIQHQPYRFVLKKNNTKLLNYG